jgi:hypothetical protein
VQNIFKLSQTSSSCHKHFLLVQYSSWAWHAILLAFAYLNSVLSAFAQFYSEMLSFVLFHPFSLAFVQLHMLLHSFDCFCAVLFAGRQFCVLLPTSKCFCSVLLNFMSFFDQFSVLPLSFVFIAQLSMLLHRFAWFCPNLSAFVQF